MGLIVLIKAHIYENGEVKKTVSVEEIKERRLNENALIWVNIEAPEPEEVKLLSEVFHFHPLSIEDCIKRSHRPKVEDYGEYYFMIFNVFKGRKKHLNYLEVYMFLGKNYLVTLYWSSLDIINSVFSRVGNNSGIFERGIDFVLYNILDSIVDDYFPLTDGMGDRIDELEELILRYSNSNIQDEILTLKRNLIKLRRVLSPQREVLNVLLRHEYVLINEENRMYYMDVYDHLLRIFDLIDTYQDMISGTMELYMTQLSNRTNDIMKVLTIATTIIMPLTLITGIYGMNFEFMPELHLKYGYFGVLSVMGLIVVLEVIYFKRKKWL
jgi:magnesium transporter